MSMKDEWAQYSKGAGLSEKGYEFPVLTDEVRAKIAAGSSVQKADAAKKLEHSPS